MKFFSENVKGDSYSNLVIFLILQLLCLFDASSCFSFPNFQSGTALTSSLRWRNSQRAFSATQLWVNASSLEDYSFTSKQETNKNNLRKEAEALKARAKEIMAEARSMEVELLASRTKLKQAKTSECDGLIDLLFPLTLERFEAKRIADQLHSERYSADLVYMVVDRLFERQLIVSGQKIPSNTEIQVGGRANVIQVNETEYQRLGDALITLTEAAAILDKKAETTDEKSAYRRWTGRVEIGIQSRINKLRYTQQQILDRKFAVEINKVANSNQSVEEYVRQSFGGGQLNNEEEVQEGGRVNVTEVPNTITLTPMWVPSSFLPFIISSGKSTLGPEQVEQIKENVLQGSRFYVTSSNSVPGAAIFRGNMRTGTGAVSDDNSTNYTAIVFDEIQSRLKRQGLASTVQMFFMPDPEWRSRGDESESEPKPVLLALSKRVSPDMGIVKNDPSLKIRNMIAYGTALMTTLAYSISAYALNPSFFEALVKKGNVKVLTSCIPVFLGVVSIQVLHEVAHYFVAKRRRMKIGRPIPLLSPMLGLYGCITQLKSFPKNRSELLDFSLSGPFAAIVASLACIYSGIFLTVRATPGALAKFPVVSVAMLKSSFLVGSLLSWLASKTLMLPLSQPVPIHPLFFIGYSGLIASALNLLPIFRLDGGRAFSAAMGSQQTVIISISALLLMMSHSLSKGTGIGFLWGIFILAFQRREEVPARDEVTKIDNFRFCICVFSYILSITILTPFPGFRGVL